jgi:bacillopeptidase F (M6 metalloprotease family)
MISRMKKATKPTKTLEGIEKTGTINISDPNVAEEFARFMRETDPKGAKKIDQTVELMNFDPKGRKKNAKGGHIKDDADVSLTIIEIPDISQSGVESLFKRR